MLFGWLSTDPREGATVLAAMAAALRASAEEDLSVWSLGGFGIGCLRRASGHAEASSEPARGADGSYLWMSGEAFDWPSHGGIRTAADSASAAFRTRLLDAITSKGPAAIRDLDGEYQIAVWSPARRSLLLLNDRFGALPLYIGTSARGTAFAGGVRGVLMCPGVSADADVEAIREAVTFGGYRLGGRTSVRDVRMVPPAAAVTITADGVRTARYWTWSELRDGDAVDPRELLEQARSDWTAAIRKRLDGTERPGLTLSGGLDSRAILAEATRQGNAMTALTYGVPHADDVSIARRSARAAGARWELVPLYQDGWLERRTGRIHETDGLMDLVDLMHTEVLDTLSRTLDTCLSGYIGDAVAGSSLFFTDRPEDLVASMPYYGGSLAISYEEAVARAVEMIAGTPGPPRFAAYEHKLPQSINRVTAAARPFVNVRRPFVDYRFFETCQRIAPSWRVGQQWRERWLVSTYPEYFARIPNQQSGVPPQSSRARWQVTRVARFGWRRVLGAARTAGLPVTVPDRTYHPDERFWSTPSERALIERTILRNGSVSCDVFGRASVQDTVRGFFERQAAPVQVIGALYVFEHYHQTLAAHLGNVRRDHRSYAC